MTSLEHVANVCRTYGFPYSPDKYEGDNPHFFVYCITDMVGIMEDIKNKLLQEGFTSPEIHISATEKFRVLRYEADIIEEGF